MRKPQNAGCHFAGDPHVPRSCALRLCVFVFCSARDSAEWPERTITVVVPFAAGGPGDVVARLLASELSKRLNQGVIVENRVGASGSIGLTAVARAAPDGYTLAAMSNVILINPAVDKVPYDPLTDFAPVAYPRCVTQRDHHEREVGNLEHRGPNR